MVYTLLNLQKDNSFAALQSKAIENLMRLINSTTADFTLLYNFAQNWITYINDNPGVDPSTNLLNILTNSNGDGLWDVMDNDKSNTLILINSNGAYNFQYITYITALTTSDTSYIAILEFLNELIAL